MNESPKKRAESSLSWGFSLVKRLDIDLTESQNLFVKGMLERLS